MTFQRITNLERAFHRRFRIGEKREHHSVARRQTNQFPGRVRAAELFGTAHHLVQLVEQIALLVNEQFRVTDDVDEKDVGDFQF